MLRRNEQGRTQLTKSERELIRSIRQTEMLRWAAYQKRDELIIEAHALGIHRKIIAAAAGLHNVAHISKIARNPYRLGKPHQGRRFKGAVVDGTK